MLFWGMMNSGCGISGWGEHPIGTCGTCGSSHSQNRKEAEITLGTYSTFKASGHDCLVTGELLAIVKFIVSLAELLRLVTVVGTMMHMLSKSRHLQGHEMYQ